MKTPMQQFLDFMSKEQNREGISANVLLMNIRKKAIQLRDKDEKEAIQNAFNAGYEDAEQDSVNGNDSGRHISECSNANDYYSDNFKND
jgi:hypothetical protein